MLAGAEMNAQAVWHAEQLIDRLGGENRLCQCVTIGVGIGQAIGDNHPPGRDQGQQPMLIKWQFLHLSGKLREAWSEPLGKSFDGILQAFLAAAAFAIEAIGTGAAATGPGRGC